MDFEGLLVQPVKRDPDLAAFHFPFALEAKALETMQGEPADVVTVKDNGDMFIEGYAAVFDGVDRQGENFIPGAFNRGIASFMSSPAKSLCYHHDHKMVLGEVLDLKEIEGKGLYMKARVDGAIQKSPILAPIYDQIKRGTLKALSVGGFFRRKLTPAGYRINGVDFTEVSVTGVPVHTKPGFAVVAGKALEALDAGEHEPEATYDFDPLLAALDKLAEAFPEGKAVKGDHLDLEFLAAVLKLEQLTNSLLTTKDVVPETSGSGDVRVDALAKRVKNYLDGVAREAHALAAELGPLPSVG
jgi:HK97 family phage prohead protease